MKQVMMSGQRRRRQDWVNVFTLLVRLGRLGDMPQCARVVASSARVTQTAAAIFIMGALHVADVVFQCCRKTSKMATCLAATFP